MIKQIKPDAVRPNVYDCMDKINELVDAVNALQSRIDSGAQPDPYPELRKWLGKLCRFWDDDKSDSVYGVLCRICKTNHYYFFQRNKNEGVYKYCEPITADDELIYKGE